MITTENRHALVLPNVPHDRQIVAGIKNKDRRRAFATDQPVFVQSVQVLDQLHRNGVFFLSVPTTNTLHADIGWSPQVHEEVHRNVLLLNQVIIPLL